MPRRNATLTPMRRLAGLELNALLYAETIPRAIFQNTRVSKEATPIYDLNGEILFYRIPIIAARGPAQAGYADTAASPALGEVLLAVAHGQAWDAASLLYQAEAIAKERFQTQFDQVRFVAYSMPKLAVQFLAQGEEQLMLELYTWEMVPPAQRRSQDEPPSNFERWSYLDELPAERREENRRRFAERAARWQEQLTPERLERFRPELLNVDRFGEVFTPIAIKRTTRELHYSQLNADHDPCYELRGQLTNVWCVAASVQMLLDFYRYTYAQTRIAADLGLGTISSPNGLPYSQDGQVVTVIEQLTSNALDATMNRAPAWDEFVQEILANRPLISFVPGHSRTVAGFTQTELFGWYLFRGLLVYDPWPPTGGVITRWENFGATSYRVTYTARLHLV